MHDNTIADRILALRRLMCEAHLHAFIIPSSDPHNSEYLPDHWKGREWLTGFDGSAGTAVVTMDRAALWTDSRYFIAAAEQLRGTEFVLMKERIAGTPSVAEWLGECLAEVPQARVGIDGMVSMAAGVDDLATGHWCPMPRWWRIRWSMRARRLRRSWSGCGPNCARRGLMPCS